IMIIDTTKTVIPFDLAPYRCIEFSPDLRGVEKLREMLVRYTRAIQGETLDSAKDNPVHDFLPGLPENIYDSGGEAESALRKQVAQLKEHLRRLADRFGVEAFDFSEDQQQSAASIILTALNQAQRGELPIDLLRRAQVAARSEDRPEFLSVLRQLVEAPASSVSSDGWLELGGAASGLQLEDVSIALYERAVEVSPADQRVMRIYLAALGHCQDPRLRERARSELAEVFGVSFNNGEVHVPLGIP